ncbi:MAG: protease-like activity factor CPAF [Chlamydiia bacterium]|nr:protease-like activity factor CPAF [Chlamydiia bacterium]
MLQLSYRHLLSGLIALSPLVSATLNAVPTADTSAEQRREWMLRDFETIQNAMEMQYAPLEWKEAHHGWSLIDEANAAKEAISSADHPTTALFQSTLKKFLGSPSDLHVQFCFCSTAMAGLPFAAAKVENAVRVTWVDPDSPLYGQIAIGDEWIDFDGRPLSDHLTDYFKSNGVSSPSDTHYALATLALTRRYGASGDEIPFPGAIALLSFKTASGEMRSFWIPWNVIEEEITPLFRSLSGERQNEGYTLVDLYAGVPSESRLRGGDGRLTAEIHTQVTGRKVGFLPALGPVLSRPVESETFDNYLFQGPGGRRIGYVRIPDYTGGPEEVEEFARIIRYMQWHSDALVIDQLNNLGGYLPYMYAIASHLTSQPLHAPLHRLTITPSDALEAHWSAEDLRGIYEFLPNLSEQHVVSLLDKFFLGYLDEPQHLLGRYISYYETIRDLWKKGVTLSHPIGLMGIDAIQPSPRGVYTKPIVMLVNELCVSAGDFLPAILQDEKRVFLYGNRTSGAGGIFRSFAYPNQLGVRWVGLTASICTRKNGQPIESLGVTPDRTQKITLRDLRENYRDYLEGIHQTLNNLLNRELR